MLLEKLAQSELILNPDGSIYHLKLRPEQVAKTIILVGDPDRVIKVSKHFDVVEHEVQKREFITHTGRIGEKRLTVISTGIGTGNIDIVINEIDALFNIDLKTRNIKEQHTSLDFIRIGTSGCLIRGLPIDAVVVSSYGIGLDNLMNYYHVRQSWQELKLQTVIQEFLKKEREDIIIKPYIIAGAESLLKTIGKDLHQGMTLTAPGFYGPQGRQLRAKNKRQGLLDVFSAINTVRCRFEPHMNNNELITNFEMETAAIYGLTRMLGHRGISFNALIANRLTGRFSKDPKKAIENLIRLVLDKIS